MHYQAAVLGAILALFTGSIVGARNPTCEYEADENFIPKGNYAGEMKIALSEYRVDNSNGSENNVTAGATMGWFKGWTDFYQPGSGSRAFQCFDICQPCLNVAAASNQTDAICKHYTISVAGRSGHCWIGFHVVNIDWAVNSDPVRWAEPTYQISSV